VVWIKLVLLPIKEDVSGLYTHYGSRLAACLTAYLAALGAALSAALGSALSAALGSALSTALV
jgi:hypothetical protein